MKDFLFYIWFIKYSLTCMRPNDNDLWLGSGLLIYIADVSNQEIRTNPTTRFSHLYWSTPTSYEGTEMKATVVSSIFHLQSYYVIYCKIRKITLFNYYSNVSIFDASLGSCVPDHGHCLLRNDQRCPIGWARIRIGIGSCGSSSWLGEAEAGLLPRLGNSYQQQFLRWSGLYRRIRQAHQPTHVCRLIEWFIY